MSTKHSFVELLLEQQVLTFGQFKTKSGRTSPYFFNTGQLNDGKSLARAGKIYAVHLREWLGDGVEFIYGPSYKGIPLAVSVAEKLSNQTNVAVKFTFNRKEAKDHGEGGNLVGHVFKGGEKVVIVEDVLTGGTSLRETMDILGQYHVQVQGVLVGIDRQERGLGKLSARREIEKKYHIPVRSVVNLDEIVNMLLNQEVLGKVWIDDNMLAQINHYRDEYGAKD